MFQFLKVKEDKAGKFNFWKVRHNEALENPMLFERPIIYALDALEQYRARHLQRYGSKVEDDGVLSQGVADIAKGIRTLLNGELGRLGAGTLDGYLVKILIDCGEEL